MSTEIKKVAKRVQIAHRKIFDEGKTIYEYDYEITEPNGKTYKKTIKRKVTSTKVPRFIEAENRESVLEVIKKYISEKEIVFDDLRKRTKIQEVLKPIRDYIIDEIYVRVNLPVLKNLILTEILKEN